MEPKNAGALLSDIRGPKGKGVRKSLILVEAQGSELSDDVKKEFRRVNMRSKTVPETHSEALKAHG